MTSRRIHTRYGAYLTMRHLRSFVKAADSEEVPDGTRVSVLGNSTCQGELLAVFDKKVPMTPRKAVKILDSGGLSSDEEAAEALEVLQGLVDRHRDALWTYGPKSPSSPVCRCGHLLSTHACNDDTCIAAGCGCWGFKDRERK